MTGSLCALVREIEGERRGCLVCVSDQEDFTAKPDLEFRTKLFDLLCNGFPAPPFGCGISTVREGDPKHSHDVGISKKRAAETAQRESGEAESPHNPILGREVHPE